MKLIQDFKFPKNHGVEKYLILVRVGNINHFSLTVIENMRERDGDERWFTVSLSLFSLTINCSGSLSQGAKDGFNHENTIRSSTLFPMFGLYYRFNNCIRNALVRNGAYISCFSIVRKTKPRRKRERERRCTIRIYIGMMKREGRKQEIELVL